MKPICILTFFLLLYSNSFSQNIEFQISGISNTTYLSEVIGETTIIQDSFPSNPNGIYNLSLNKSKYHEGVYQFNLNNNHWINFIYDGDDINIRTSASDIIDSMHIIKSESTRLFYAFVKLNRDYKSKTKMLQLILARYPKDDDYYITTKDKLVSIQREYADFIKSVHQNHRGSFIDGYISSAQLPIISLEIPPENQIEYLRAHALDKVDFNDDQLIYSDVFVNKVIEYLTYYSNPQLSKELLEKEFMTAADVILNKAKVNQVVYKHVIEYMIDGFKKFGFDNILDYLVDNYVIKDNICLDAKSEVLINKRIDQAKILKVGTQAPNIIIPDSFGNIVDLYKIQASKILLVFYASWCPHCQDLLPKLNGLKDMKIVAISLDTSRVDWLNFVNGNSLSYLNTSDLKGWDGKAADDYFIYATPTMFVLDSNKKIISKPKNFEDLESGIGKEPK